jgi:hypothetical protein
MLILNELWERGASPSIAVITHAIRLACDNGMPRLAIGIADEHDKGTEVGTRLPLPSWVRILMSSAENSYVSRL